MKKFILLFILILLPFAKNYAQNNFAANDSAAIVQTALDYGDGFYSGDAIRMERALHPDFNKVYPVKISETGNTVLYYSTFSGLVEMTRSKAGYLEEGKRKEAVTVLKIDNNIAFAKITTALFNDYLEMVKIEEQWKIINVLWTDGPDSQRKKDMKDFNPENERESIKQAVQDLYEGIFSGDASKIEKSAHLESNFITLYTSKNNSVFINKDGFAMLREVANSKLNLKEKDLWNLQIDILDIMDGLAAVRVELPSGISYLQLAKMDGAWKIINSLKNI